MPSRVPRISARGVNSHICADAGMKGSIEGSWLETAAGLVSTAIGGGAAVEPTRERYPNGGKHFNLVFIAVVLPWKFPAGGGAVVAAAGSAKFFLAFQSAGSNRERNFAREAEDCGGPAFNSRSPAGSAESSRAIFV